MVSLRIAAGITLLIVATIFPGEAWYPSSVLFTKAAWAQIPRPNELSVYRMQAKSLKPYLPQFGVIGYVQGDPSSLADHFRLLLVRHALAPLVVESNTSSPFVVGISMDVLARDKVARQYNLRLIKDFGNGLVLFTGGSGS